MFFLVYALTYTSDCYIDVHKHIHILGWKRVEKLSTFPFFNPFFCRRSSKLFFARCSNEKSLLFTFLFFNPALPYVQSDPRKKNVKINFPSSFHSQIIIHKISLTKLPEVFTSRQMLNIIFGFPCTRARA